ncbi:MAG: carbohydrate-binding domain-containing protein, partial [Oscillospiraceae bacterium]|nr:carbohydrate-binding domain-containing protein [Oscillospiraceae bacterium]
MRAIRIAAAAVLVLVLTSCSVYTVLYGGQLHKRKTDIMSEKEVSQAVNANNCKLIELVTDTVKVSGGGAAVSGSTVTIRKPGTYRISGTLEDGQILVDVDEGAVALLLDGASVSCSSGPALHVLDSRKLVLYLTEGTS